MQKKVNIYACGGTAANIVGMLLADNANIDVPGLAALSVTFVDTSRSNLPIGQEDKFYHVHDPSVIADGRSETDGSGKDRRFAYELAIKQAPQVVRKHTPTDFNIVVHSGYGGSGSVLGPAILKEILDSKKDVFVIMIGGEGDEAGIVNTQRVLYGYQQLAEKLERSVPVSYLHIDKQNPTSVVYAEAIRIIGYIAALCSGQNHGLDSQDIHNFLNSEIKSKFKPSLMGIIFTEGSEDTQLQEGEALSGMLSLVEHDDQAEAPLLTPYHAFGKTDAAVFGHLGSSSPIRALAVQNHFVAIDTILRSKAHAHAEAFKSVTTEKLALSGDDLQVTDSGIVL